MQDCLLLRKYHLLKNDLKKSTSEKDLQSVKSEIFIKMILLLFSFLFLILCFIVPPNTFKFEMLIIYQFLIISTLFSKTLFFDKKNNIRNMDDLIVSLLFSSVANIAISTFLISFTLYLFNIISSGVLVNFENMLYTHITCMMIAVSIFVFSRYFKVKKSIINGSNKEQNKIKNELSNLKNELLDKYDSIEKLSYAELISKHYNYQNALTLLANQKNIKLKQAGYSSYDNYQAKKLELEINQKNTNKIKNDLINL